MADAGQRGHLGLGVGRMEAFSDGVLAVVITLLILDVKVLPWPTAVLAEYVHEGTDGDQRVAVVLYGVTSTVMALGFNALWRYVLRHAELWKPGVDRAALTVRNRRYNLGAPLYPAATLLGLLSVTLFIAAMLALAVLYLLPTPEIRGERHPADPPLA